MNYDAWLLIKYISQNYFAIYWVFDPRKRTNVIRRRQQQTKRADVTVINAEISEGIKLQMIDCS